VTQLQAKALALRLLAVLIAISGDFKLSVKRRAVMKLGVLALPRNISRKGPQNCRSFLEMLFDNA
jgi:hypothetical protein